MIGYIIIGVLVASLIGGAILSSQMPIIINDVSTINKTLVENASKTPDFSVWDWVKEPNWGQIIWNAFAMPFNFLKWLVKGINAGACWIINIFGVKGCPEFLGWLILIPLLFFFVWKASEKLLKLSTTYTTILLAVLGIIFFVGIMLVFLGVI